MKFSARITSTIFITLIVFLPTYTLSQEVEGLYDKALEYQNAGDYAKAIELYTRIIALDPSHVNSFWNRAIVYGKEEKYDLAITDLHKVNELVPDFPDAYGSLSWYLILQSKFAEAKFAAERAIELKSQVVRSLIVKSAHAHLFTGDTEAAQKYYQKALSLYKSEEEFRAELIADFDLLISRSVSSGISEKYRRWNIYEYYLTHGWNEKAAALEPKESRPLINLGHARLLEGDTISARGYYQRALRLMKSKEELQDGAIADFDRFISNGRNVYACQAFRQWLLKHYAPEKAYQHGQIAFKDGNYEQAVKDFTLTIEDDPYHVEAYWSRSNSYYHLDKYQLAVNDLRKVVQMWPYSGPAYANLGWNLILLGKFPQALDATRKASELENGAAAPIVNLGHIFLLTKDAKNVEVYYKAALKMIRTAEEIETGPIADLERFIKQGWQEKECRKYLQWWRTQLENTFSLAKAEFKILESKPSAVEDGHDVNRSTTISPQQPEIVVQTGHSDDVTALAFSLDGRILASGSKDKTVRLWDAHSGRQVLALSHPSIISYLTFTAASEVLLAVGNDNKIISWEVASGKERTQGSATDVIAISPVDNLVAQGGYSGGTIMLWDLSTGKELRRLVGHSEVVFALAFSSDGRFLASESDDRTMKLWKTSTGEVLMTQEVASSWKWHGRANSVTFAQNDNILTNFQRQGYIKSWEVATTLPHRDLKVDLYGSYGPDYAAFSPDGNILATADKRTANIILWDTNSGQKLRKYKGLEEVRALAFSPDGRTLASGGKNGVIRFWDAETGKEFRKIVPIDNPVSSVAFSADGRLLASGNGDHTIRLWDLQSGQKPLILTGHPEKVLSVVFSPDGHMLASASTETENHYGMIIVWDVATGKVLYQKENLRSIFMLAYSPDGDTLASVGFGSKVQLWDSHTGNKLHEIDRGPPIAFGFHSKLFAMGDQTRTMGSNIEIFDRKSNTWSKLTHQHRVNAVALNSNDSLLVTGGEDQTVNLWVLNSKSGSRVFRGHQGPVTSVVFSPTTNLFASASEDNTIKLWDVNAGAESRTLSGHRGPVRSIAFSPSGKILASGSDDGKIALWNVATGKELTDLIAVPAQEWIVVTPEGRFDGSEEGIKRVHYRQNNRSIPLEAFFEQLYTPRLLARVFDGEAELAEAPAIDLTGTIKLPPRVRIVSPKAGEAFTTDNITVTIEVVDQGGGIDEVRLYQNNKLISQNQRNIKPVGSSDSGITTSFPVRLIAGMNELKAIGFNADRTESDPAVIRIELKAREPEARLYILGVGINDYKNAGYNLNYGRPDAESFVQAVERGGKGIFKHIFKQNLYDGQATRQSIDAALNLISAEAQPQDVFVFFYAGHGVMSEGDDRTLADYYLVLHDVTNLYGDHAMLATRGLPAEKLKDYFVKIRAQKQLVVFDACQAGGALEKFGLRGMAEEKAILQLARSTGIVVLAASGTEQFATEFPQLGHGVFTYALLRGLDGDADGGTAPDGKITVQELAAYLNDKVPELTSKYRGSPQYPNSYMRGQDFPLGVAK